MEATFHPIPFRDPFSSTADPGAYVPRTATEAALVQLEAALRDGARVVSLAGPDGSGKTLLLRLLTERLAGDFQTVLVPYPKLPPAEFCQWSLAALHEPSAGDPELDLAARIARGADSGEPPLLWLIDDADCLPIETLRCLLRLQASDGDAMHVLLVRPVQALLAELTCVGLPRIEVRLDGDMDSSETAHYVRMRLDRAGAGPDQRARFERWLERLYADTGGNPSRIHAAASTLLCFSPPEIAAEEVPLEVFEDDRGEVVEVVVPEVAEAEPAAPAAAELLAAPDELVPAPPLVPTEPLLQAPPPHGPGPRKRRRLRRFGRR